MSNDSKRDSKLPAYFTKDPDVTEPELVAKRREQWRHFSRDPYKPAREDEKSSQPAAQVPEAQKQEPKGYSRLLKHPGSGWTLLFYDLAWTATFATLAQNGSFIEPLDALSYFGFFAAMMWLWASQTLYSVHFYTNDWFHLTSIFLQMILFGLLAATTKGYHLTNYISRSPGSTTLNSNSDELSDADELQRFNAEKTDQFSARAMATAFALTRFLHLLQYLRACYYAGWGKGVKTRGHVPRGRFRLTRVPAQIDSILVGLIFSNMMLFAAMGIMFSAFGTTVTGASVRLGLWIGGFLLEVISHLWFPVVRQIARHRRKNKDLKTAHWTEDVNPLPVAKVDLRERLDTITTIILGEGINGFAGTLTSILTAAGVGKAVLVNVASTAFTIWFIAYMYFEGPKSGSNPEGEGIKNQFLLTSFLSTINKSLEGFRQLLGDQDVVQRLQSSDTTLESDTAIKNFLFARNMIWRQQYQELYNLFRNAPNITESLDQMNAWRMRLSMRMVSNTYEARNCVIDLCNEADIVDAKLATDLNVDLGEMQYYKILTELLNGSFEGARYILAFAALIPVCLGIQCIIHSLPRDRYQWAVITSRLVLGLILALLLFLNLGKYQEFYVSRLVANQRAGVFLWLEAFWVLPTIAIGYAVQFLLEIILAYFAKKATERADIQAKAEAGVRTSAMVIGGGEILNQLPSLPRVPHTDPPSSEQGNRRSAGTD
ncbi:BEACH domain-containing protein lvsC [Dictyostelium discoideum] [Rhizoctonia solani]|uniref:BEACH domain-containing protein lvsC [Dictyostelium discoideum] n=1 Tax=Rhizoctonia solani TaxID=456999 RepID=A0A0K6FV57_9AGAM|nr:BEACH domain-containing protein lvsC [Dictyostelium discoideum] [Rhizoctonia solani]